MLRYNFGIFEWARRRDRGVSISGYNDEISEDDAVDKACWDATAVLLGDSLIVHLPILSDLQMSNNLQ